MHSILIVDDDSSTRTLIADAIQAEGINNVTEVEDGFKALEIIKKSPFDLIISDLKMPGMNGIELLHTIKEIHPATSVIIITGYPSIDISIAAMKYGAVDFLTKPFNIDDLIFKIKVYLNEKKILTDQEMDYKINTSRLTEKVRELSTISYIYDSIEKARGNNDDIFEEIASLAMKITPGENCSIVLVDDENLVFHPKAMKGGNNGGIAALDALLPSLYPVFTEVIQNKDALIRSSNGQNPYKSILCVPLMIRNRVFGLLTLINSQSDSCFTVRDLNYISSLTARASLNLENRILYESIFTSIIDTFKSLVRSIHLRDQYTERHSVNVTRLSVMTARSMQLSPDDIECLEISSILHDIGKIAIPDNILLKPGGLTDAEYDTIKTHPTIGENILKSIRLFETERKIVRHHHERWDGRGYPDGLSGLEIPLLSRVLSVADAYDAMTSDRPYRKGLSVEKALGELRRNINTQFDKDAVDAFISTVQSQEANSEQLA
ncbi:MAG: response regulator [Deltaproteobacteria bacterium]|nr:response regulator [Deltaproteobacteria bacterium]